MLLENNANVSVRQNVQIVGLSVSSFNRITRNELKWYPDIFLVRHQVTESDFQRRLDFAHWFICIWQNN